MKKRLHDRKRLMQFALSLCLILVSTYTSWAQQTIGSFKYMDGGFEGQSTGNLTQTTSGSANVWTKSAAASTSSIVANASLARSGSKYAIGNLATGGSNRGLQTPLGASVAGSHVIQFYYRNYPATTNIQAGIAAVNGTIQISTSTSTDWVKASFVVTSTALASTYSYVGRLNPPTTFSYDVDDVVVYAGTVVDETAPTVLASNPIASLITSSQQTISWDPSTDNDFSGYMVVRGIADPATTPKVNGIYAVGNTVATGEQVVYMGNGNSFTDLGLTTGTTYFYRIYTVDKAFNYSATALSLNSTTTAPIVAATDPTVQASGLTLGNVTGSTLDISWTEGDGTNSLVLVKAASAVDTDPTDGGIYTANLAFGSGTQIGTGNYAVYTGTDNSATITGLTRGTTYFVKVYTFNVNAPGSQNYLATSPASGSILNLPYQNTFTFNSTTEGFTAVSPRATAVYASESGLGTVQWKYASGNNNALNSKVTLSATYSKVDGTTYKYAHITLKNTTLTNNNIQLNSNNPTAVAFNPRQNVSVADTGYKTYDFDLTGWTGDQQPELNMSVKNTFSYAPAVPYVQGDIVIEGNTYCKNISGANSISPAIPRTDTVNWSICDVTGAITPAPGAVLGGALDFTNTVFIDSIVFDNILPTLVSNGTGGGAWGIGTTWAGGIVPGVNDNVNIVGSDAVDSTGTRNCNQLSIAVGSSLTLAGGSLTVNNGIINNGTITIDNNANLVQTAAGIDTNSGSGTATVKRNSNPLLRSDYTLWSSPVTGQNLLAFSPATTTTRFNNYNTATNLYNAEATPGATPFTVGKGYLIRMPNTDLLTGYDAGSVTLVYPGQFTGTLNNGTIPVPITAGAFGLRYNLVGNPYPSPINIWTFVSENTDNIESTLYFWRKTNGLVGQTSAYCTFIPGALVTDPGTFTTNSNALSADPLGVIQTGQGFFVEAKSGATTLTFNNTQRVINAANLFFRTKQVEEPSKIWLNATNAAGNFSQMAVTYFDGATLGVDAFDAKYINDSDYALTSDINQEEYIIQGRPAFDASDIVALNFKTALAGDYTIAIDHTKGVFSNGQDVYLVDSKTGAETDLKAGSYTFNATAGIDNARFSLKYQKTLKVDAPAFNENSVRVYKNNGTVYVNSGKIAINSIQVYDVQGRLIAERKNVKSSTATLENLKANNQVLLVKISGEDNSVVTKKVVN